MDKEAVPNCYPDLEVIKNRWLNGNRRIDALKNANVKIRQTNAKQCRNGIYLLKIQMSKTTWRIAITPAWMWVGLAQS